MSVSADRVNAYADLIF